METFVCPNCNFSYLVAQKGNCVNCGYYFDYIVKYKNIPLKILKSYKETIKIRTFLFAVIEQDNERKGIHCHIIITNHGLKISVIDKFSYGLFTKKRWVMKTPQEFFVPYDDIVEISKGTHKGKPAGYYTYKSKSFGNLRLLCVDGSASSSINVSEEVKRMVEQLR